MAQQAGTVRAKFQCFRVDDQGYAVHVQLSPVYSDSEENKAFWKATPSGQLDMYISNPEASKNFEVGKSYYLDFIPADEPAPAETE